MYTFMCAHSNVNLIDHWRHLCAVDVGTRESLEFELVVVVGRDIEIEMKAVLMLEPRCCCHTSYPKNPRIKEAAGFLEYLPAP